MFICKQWQYHGYGRTRRERAQEVRCVFVFVRIKLFATRVFDVHATYSTPYITSQPWRLECIGPRCTGLYKDVRNIEQRRHVQLPQVHQGVKCTRWYRPDVVAEEMSMQRTHQPRARRTSQCCCSCTTCMHPSFQHRSLVTVVTAYLHDVKQHANRCMMLC